jgi:hypothetical protein
LRNRRKRGAAGKAQEMATGKGHRGAPAVDRAMLHGFARHAPSSALRRHVRALTV